MNRITAQLGDQLSHVSLSGRRRPEPPPTLVLAAHGSRDPRTLATVTSLLNRVRELRPSLPVRLGHIELNEPLLTDTLAALGPGRAVLVPLLLGRGYHVKQDLPAAAAAAPHLHTRIAAPLGPHPLLVEALYARLVEAGWPTGPRACCEFPACAPTPGTHPRCTASQDRWLRHMTCDAAHRGHAPNAAAPALRADDGELTTGPGFTPAVRRSAGVVLAAAGSSDPEGLADTRRTAQELAERLGVPVIPAYASAAAPTVAAALRSLAARGRHRAAVASYFTAPGRFAAQSAAGAPWIAAAPLGAHPAVAQLLLHRYDQALTATTTTDRLQLASAS
ncbi:sirohydrochlorin chelatase [Streptomyces sp. NBC_01304]|uniref:sirohydrochlorin chelatase n=1 Tax=Streptomyces sp. NBC_01304 TaxID=2903818 RepID=UPI002E1350DD|nr:sirohydrochlorin chelatase [Streptomyces sp. NBC_01304]